jgi:hypothetical protein
MHSLLLSSTLVVIARAMGYHADAPITNIEANRALDPDYNILSLAPRMLCMSTRHGTTRTTASTCSTMLWIVSAAVAWCRDTLSWRHIDHTPQDSMGNMPQILPLCLAVRLLDSDDLR